MALSAGGLGARRAAAAAFNARSRWRKRGFAAVPTKFGISFTTKFLNQVLRKKAAGKIEERAESPQTLNKPLTLKRTLDPNQTLIKS